jgi:Cu(I)/Ag(I) efflux system membrane fusion protein
MKMPSGESGKPGDSGHTGDSKGSAAPPGTGSLEDAPAAFRDGVRDLVAAYLVLQEKLAGDDLPGSREALESLDARLDALSPADLDTGARTAWDGVARDLSGALTQARGASDLHGVRSAFGSLTTAVLVLEKAFGPPTKETHRLLFCPMAFNNQGAFWLQTGDAVRNPYFGSSMLTCGEVRETFTGKNGGAD